MPLRRKTPAGLESANTRGGGCRFHQHLDTSCELDMEQLRYGCGGFSWELLDDMRFRPLAWLELHHPEFVFGLSLKKPRKGDCDYMAELRRGRWRTARWRTA
jgi:hypothetical protein